ncbi:hypothetical protein [Kibdelosporangium phytohabitans]|nr:hypothetical protein [Kibdelosporangium phytohabitans]MBE1471419.1 hypothetical protein [Kibdelosporangium phytohabitans]
MTTAYDIPVPELVQALMSPSIEVSIWPVPGLQCEYCAEVGAITTVRVMAVCPRRDVFQPIDDQLVCGLCAPDVIDRVIEEHDPRSGRLPLVEVTD